MIADRTEADRADIHRRYRDLQSAYQERYAELLEADRCLRTFHHLQERLVAILTHDLQRPLHIILGHVTTLEQGRLGPLGERQVASIRAIHRQARRLEGLLDQLLSLRCVESVPPPGQPPGDGADEAEKPLILLVEDDTKSALALEELLGEQYAVYRVDDGEQALDYLRGHRPQVILLDLCLPRLDGFAVMNMLNTDRDLCTIPVILISAQGDATNKTQAFGLGAVDYLVKPFDIHELHLRLELAVRCARQRERYRAVAETDQLTGLLNYRAFCARLEEEFSRAARYCFSLAAIMIELENLPQIVERQGSLVGNRALLGIARILRSITRDTDVVCRFGEGEFALLLPHATREQADCLLARLAQELRVLERGGDWGIPLRVSFGCSARVPRGDPATTPVSLIHEAALNRAERGRSGLSTG